MRIATDRRRVYASRERRGCERGKEVFERIEGSSETIPIRTPYRSTRWTRSKIEGDRLPRERYGKSARALLIVADYRRGRVAAAKEVGERGEISEGTTRRTWPERHPEGCRELITVGPRSAGAALLSAPLSTRGRILGRRSPPTPVEVQFTRKRGRTCEERRRE